MNEWLERNGFIPIPTQSLTDDEIQVLKSIMGEPWEERAMRQRSLDEMITYFNQEIDKMDIDRRYKIALLGMVTAIGCAAKPTIEERKRGKWVPHPNREFREWDVCTACGVGCKRREYGKELNGLEWVTEYNYQFCPNCGSYNGGGDE